MIWNTGKDSKEVNWHLSLHVKAHSSLGGIKTFLLFISTSEKFVFLYLNISLYYLDCQEFKTDIPHSIIFFILVFYILMYFKPDLMFLYFLITYIKNLFDVYSIKYRGKTKIITNNSFLAI